MPISRAILDNPPEAIGNAFVLGGSNEPFRDEYFLNPTYSILPSDYYAGAIQFLYTIDLQLSVDYRAGLDFIHGNPGYGPLGHAVWSNLNDRVLRRDAIEYSSQQLQYLGPQIRLDRQEAARPKRYLLGSRPRFLISNSAQLTPILAGRVTVANMTYNGGGTITSVPPAVFTETGTIFQAPESPPNLSIPSRSFRLDVTDGDFSMISQQEDGIYYISTPINNLGDTWRVSKLRLFLRVGATGTIKTTVYKLTESDNSAATPPNNSPYIPASTFPSP